MGAGDAARAAGVGVVGVCVFAGRALPGCHAAAHPATGPPIRGPGPVRQHSGEPGRCWSVQDLSSHQCPSSLHRRGPVHGARPGPGSGSSGHAASKRQKNTNRRRQCDWFRNHHRRAVQPVRTVSAERNGSMRAQKRHLRENIRHAPPSRASPRALVVFSPRLPLCLPPILAIMRR